MAVYKKSVNLLPKLSEEDLIEKEKISQTALYAAILPLFAALVWVVALLVTGFYKNQEKNVDEIVSDRQEVIGSYDGLREKQTALVMKVEALTELVGKDFFPQKFFDLTLETINSTGDAQAELYAYTRADDGLFGLQGKANSYLDLAKIMVAFNSKPGFSEVNISSIHYDKEKDDVNFEIIFYYEDIELDETI